MKKNLELTDIELVSQYRETLNLEILGNVYERYIHLVYGVCLKYLKDREPAKDAVSDIFEKLITDLERTSVDNFKSWLYVVTKNHCLMQLRKSANEKKKTEQFSETRFMESTEQMHPIDEDNKSVLEEKLKRCIEKLKKEQQHCIKLFYYDKKCYKEIAQHLDIDEKKVKSFIQNGKRNLKICIEQREVVDE